MDRVKGLGSFAVITVLVLLSLRLVHVATPVMFPSTRIGPIEIASLDDVRRLTGFAPVTPAYRPATLGAKPVRMTVILSPRPTFTISWREGESFLTVIQHQGGARPDTSPLSQPLRDVPDSIWWTEGATNHVVIQRGDFWITLETSLSTGELRRFVDTLSGY